MKSIYIKMNSAVFGGAVLGILFNFYVSASAGEPMEGWTGDVFVGYNTTSGNTDKASGSLSAQAVRKVEKSELTLRGNVFYSESNKKMDGQKWDGLIKYSYDFGHEERWFNFTQLMVDHDYFADINYRITPATGLGYHIARSEGWTWDVDAGIGYRITRYRLNASANDEALTALAHTFMKKKVIGNAFLSEDFTAYPALNSDAGIVLRSSAAFTTPISERVDFELKYIVDHNSKPAAGKKKTDSQFILGVKYKF